MRLHGGISNQESFKYNPGGIHTFQHRTALPLLYKTDSGNRHFAWVSLIINHALLEPSSQPAARSLLRAQPPGPGSPHAHQAIPDFDQDSGGSRCLAS